MKTSTPSLRPPRLKPEGAGVLAAFTERKPGGMPLVMGVLNATPDSFYPASRFQSPEEAVEKALSLAEEGADWIDIGGQSTRPGSEGVSVEDELRRVIPVVKAVSKRVKVPISIDTDKAEVARRARDLGARILNDVTALRGDPGMLKEAARFDAVILMHMRGTSARTMQASTEYEDVVTEVKEFLREQKKIFVQSGGSAARLLIDPGIGFGKNLNQNLELLRRLDSFAVLGPVVLGISRKSFLGRLMAGQKPGVCDLAAAEIPGPEERLEASLAAACWAMLRGVSVLRVHDVRATRRALTTLAVLSGVRHG